MKVVIEQSDSTIEIMGEKEFQKMVDELDEFDGIHPYIFLGYLCDKKQVSVKPDVMVQTAEEIDALIKEQMKYFSIDNGKQYCGLCLEDDYCYHEIKIDVLRELKKRLSSLSK